MSVVVLVEVFISSKIFVWLWCCKQMQSSDSIWPFDIIKFTFSNSMQNHHHQFRLYEKERCVFSKCTHTHFVLYISARSFSLSNNQVSSFFFRLISLNMIMPWMSRFGVILRERKVWRYLKSTLREMESSTFDNRFSCTHKNGEQRREKKKHWNFLWLWLIKNTYKDFMFRSIFFL